MKRRILLAAAFMALLAAVYYFISPVPPSESTPVVTTTPLSPGNNLTLRTNDDPQDIFQRAFWRRPTPDDRILHAERREWVSEEDGVRRWQWFLAVKPGTALKQWLLEDNAFGLDKVAGATPLAGFTQLPSWFPTQGGLAKCEVRQAAGSKMTLLFDSKKNVFYATDAGHGFAVVRKD